MDPIVSTTLGAAGLLVALASTTHAIFLSNGKRFLERARGLADLRASLEIAGPLQSDHASADAVRVHKRLLADLDSESRANAVLYLQVVGRLVRPGSFLLSALHVVYGFVMVSLITNSPDKTVATSAATAWVNIVVALIAVVLIGFGVWGFFRRLKTRQLRKKIGIVDPVSGEAIKRFARVFRTGRLGDKAVT